MPRIAEIEFTPNPNARKFILREPLSYGVSKSYEDASAAAGDPLAEALFAIAHVTNVFYVDHWITVTQDGKAHWPELLRQLAVPIRDAPSAQEHSEELINQGADRPDGTTFDESKLSYQWHNDDPSLDSLCQEIQSLIQAEEKRGATRAEIFAKIWTLAHDRPIDFHLPARATVPYLNEPWYC